MTAMVDEGARVAALRSYGLLDAPRPVVLDELTRLAASIAGTPMSVVTLVDAERQWFAGRTGFPGEQAARDVSFCAHTMAAGRPIAVPDATRDPRFAGFATVTGDPHIRFYAGAPLVDEDGHPLGAVCVIDDRPREAGDRLLDDLAMLAGQAAGHLAAIRSRRLLAELGDELARAGQREDDLVAAISHELRTPVATIQGYLEILTDDDALAAYRPIVEPIQRNGERLVQMVDHLLAGSRPAGAPLAVHRSPVDLATVVQAAAVSCAPLAARGRVTVELPDPGASAPAVADFTRLCQATGHLLRNAIQHTPPGGRVTVRVTGGGTPAIEVTDSGAGIPAAELPYVCDRFYRGRHSRVQAVAGVGLGLSIAQQVMAAHGGSVSVTSPGAGAGTTARLQLPG
ncbi:GAF domain-containing sensor histidine kinase [Spirilliplanes yamanashiensis]|uniref:histidine kinase n=1 Tax=Spirilliplanes yamanashiensis TaxID=42233 RepID=A0A8J3YA07_9ACTN|nr:GAF domain-containing sensor histidine kinase [Spirilliplanes yamanashiensis]MDP9815699.1 signal transduction histidine kinase [Spirilliplanes yamanashiensis]GIJ03953.1 sensor histidine kinase [Spirilliplanes yamanashiensis]